MPCLHKQIGMPKNPHAPRANDVRSEHTRTHSLMTATICHVCMSWPCVGLHVTSHDMTATYTTPAPTAPATPAPTEYQYGLGTRGGYCGDWGSPGMMQIPDVASCQAAHTGYNVYPSCGGGTSPCASCACCNTVTWGGQVDDPSIPTGCSVRMVLCAPSCPQNFCNWVGSTVFNTNAANPMGTERIHYCRRVTGGPPPVACALRFFFAPLLGRSADLECAASSRGDCGAFLATWIRFAAAPTSSPTTCSPVLTATIPRNVPSTHSGSVTISGVYFSSGDTTPSSYVVDQRSM